MAQAVTKNVECAGLAARRMYFIGAEVDLIDIDYRMLLLPILRFPIRAMRSKYLQKLLSQ